jgi:hypothetical protein
MGNNAFQPKVSRLDQKKICSPASPSGLAQVS